MVWQIGPFLVHGYGLVLGLAVVLGLWMAEFLGARHGMEKGVIGRAGIWSLVGGLLGARLYHVIHYSQVYSQDWLRVLYLWDGGLAIYGGLLGGVVALLLVTRKKLLVYLDLAALALPVSQAVGRVGNFLNQELYGLPARPPWGWYIEPEKRLVGFEQYEYFMPLWLYETAFNLLLFGGLVNLERKNKLVWGRGIYFGVYLIGYGLIRALLEPLRLEPWRMGGLLVGQVIGILLILGGVIWVRSANRHG